MVATMQRHTERQISTPSGGPPTAGDLAQQRAGAQRLLDAADAAIRAALSGDSEAFLAANRQQGGQ